MSRKTRERRKRQAQASTAIQEAWGDPIDYSQELGWRDIAGGYWGASTIGGDSYSRQDGANRPFLETDVDLQMMRAAARSICIISPSAKCAMNNLLSYILGNGFEYWAEAKRKEQKEQLAELVNDCNDVIDEFLENSQLSLSIEPETVRRVFRDGEAFIALYRTRGGGATARFVEPEYVTEPQNARDIEEAKSSEGGDWNFGVHTADDDVQTVYGYHVQWPGGNLADFTYFPANRMVHLKIGVDSTVKRGWSDYYAVYQYLLDSAKLLRNTVKGAGVLAAIAMIVEQATGTSASAAESLRSSGSFRAAGTSANGEEKTRYVQEYKPGSILRTPNGTAYKASPLSNNTMGESCVAIEQACLRVVGSNWNMPEYMISGDASNANYSSTLVAESPFVKFCERMQAFFGHGFKEVLWRVLEIAIECGRIPLVSSVEELKKLIKLQAEPPIVASRNAKEETDRNRVLRDAGQLSDVTWAAREGLDREQELANGAKPLEKALPSAFSPQPAPATPTTESVDRVKLAKQLLWEGYPAKQA